MDFEGHKRWYLMNQESGAQERLATETASPWRNRGQSHRAGNVTIRTYRISQISAAQPRPGLRYYAAPMPVAAPYPLSLVYSCKLISAVPCMRPMRRPSKRQASSEVARRRDAKDQLLERNAAQPSSSPDAAYAVVGMAAASSVIARLPEGVPPLRPLPTHTLNALSDALGEDFKSRLGGAGDANVLQRTVVHA